MKSKSDDEKPPASRSIGGGGDQESDEEAVRAGGKGEGEGVASWVVGAVGVHWLRFGEVAKRYCKVESAAARVPLGSVQTRVSPTF